MSNILEKIKKLHAKAESAKELGNIEEASVFASKVRELLAEYNISLRDVDVNSINIQLGPVFSIKDNQSGKAWKNMLAKAIAKLNMCNILLWDDSDCRFVGTLENIEVCTWLYNFLSTNFLSSAQKSHVSWKLTPMYIKEEGSPEGKRYRYLRNFLTNACQSFYNKQYNLLSDEQKSLIELHKEAIEIFFKKYVQEGKGNLTSKKSPGAYIGTGSNQGSEYGKSTNIGKPLTTSNNKLLN